MTDPELHRTHQQDAHQQESLGPVTPANRRLYLVLIIVLGAVLVLGVVGWLVLAAMDRAMPDGLGVILGTVAGGLVALVSDKASGQQ